MESWGSMIEAAKREIKLLQLAQVREKMALSEAMTLIDCREPDEYEKGRIPKAIFIPRGILEMTMERHFQDRDQAIVVYCAGGGRSAVAAHALKKMGYTDVASMEGGFEGWKHFGYPIEK